ncbi:MAG: hypothetical protein V3W04_01290 [Gammaproteobacteria bacterium]
MNQITNDSKFKQVIQKLDFTQQREVAALFVEHVLPLSNDERLNRVVKVVRDSNASADELASALRSAKAVTLDSHTRCGSEGKWTDQAGYFVARAATAAATPEAQSKSGGPAWQAAMSSRMAQTSVFIDSEDETPVGTEWQYDILSNYLNS